MEARRTRKQLEVRCRQLHIGRLGGVLLQVGRPWRLQAAEEKKVKDTERIWNGNACIRIFGKWWTNWKGRSTSTFPTFYDEQAAIVNNHEEMMDCDEGKRFRLNEAKWNEACVAKQDLGHAGNLRTLTMSYMGVECRHMPKYDFVWLVVDGHDKRKKSCTRLAGIWCFHCAAKYDNSCYGCVASLQHESGSRGMKIFRILHRSQVVTAT